MSLEYLDFTQVRLLAALAEKNNLSAAASSIGLSQSAASHALGRLRKILKDPLFVRTSRGLHPTPYGSRLALAAVESVATLSAGIEADREFEPRVSDRVFNIYLSDVGQIAMLPRLLSHLDKAAPGISINVHRAPAQHVASTLESGKVDMAIGTFPDLVRGFHQRLLFREHYVCIVRCDHPRFRTPMTLDAFLSVPHAIVDATHMAHAGIERAAIKHRIRRRTRLSVPEFISLPHLVASSDLLVIVPSRLAEQYARLLPIKLLPPPFPIATYDIGAYWHERYHHDSTNRWLRNTLAQVFTVK